MKVKKGDLGKLGLLFDRHNRPLFGFFYRLTRRRDVSEDLVQGVFERILRYRESYSGEGVFVTWLYRIARNHYADHYRQTARHDRFTDSAELDLFPGEDSGSAITSEEEAERQLLRRAIDELDAEKKQTLILSRYQGFSYREIADIMGCSESAVKVRVFRSLGELKEIMEILKKREKL